MRVVSDDGREVIATNEELASVSSLSNVALGDAQHLNLSFNALTSLQGLHVATQLRNLNVSHNAITSLQGIDALQQLRLVRCSGNRISDLSWLASLPHLCELWVNDNDIETPQIAHMATLRSLTTLVLHPNPCTNAVHYVSYVVKTVPWLSCVDLVVVDDALRQLSQHIDERAFLSSAATDVSEISLMTSRSESAILPDGQEDTEQTKQRPIAPQITTDPAAMEPPLATSPPPENVEVPKKKTKKMVAEDFMRAFPVQDFIPATTESVNSNDDQSCGLEPTYTGASDILPSKTTELNDVNQTSNQDEHGVDKGEGNIHSLAQSYSVPQLQQESATTSMSAIASAVLSLPLFKDDRALQKKKAIGVVKPKKPTKKDAPSKPIPIATPDHELLSFQQQEWSCTYPNSTVTAIQVRADGSAVAKWPNGSVAVSVDRERNGFRCYAAHKDGMIALSLDADGVGFINYYPSGRMLISTSSSGNGLYFSSEGMILRQWDAQSNMKDDKWEPTDRLNQSERDGSLTTKLSDGLAVRLHLRPSSKHSDCSGKGSHRPSAIDLQVYFNSGSGIRHEFCNWINKSEPNSSACDVLFGKDMSKLKKKASDTRTHSHIDTLDGIRAAVAKLS